MRHHDLALRNARERWQEIRWALFIFTDIRDVEPTTDLDVVRVVYEGARPYPNVWAIELAQRGFEPIVPAAATARTFRRAA